MEAFEIPAEVGGGRRERDDPEDAAPRHQVGDQREDVVVLLEAPAVVAPGLSQEVPAVAPPQDLVARVVVAPAPSLVAAPAQVREGEVQGEAVQEGAGTVAGTTITGTAIDRTLGGTTGDGGEGRLSLG